MENSALRCITSMVNESKDLTKNTLEDVDLEMVAVDALPDELLLHILSFVADARTLLYAVPLVCRRWHRLHRDPAAWSRVHLSCMVDDEEDAWVLRHAPAARTLRLDGHHEDDREGRGSVRHCVRALGRSRVAVGRRLTVTEHAVHTLASSDPTIPTIVLDRLLRQQSDGLRDLDLFVSPFVCFNDEGWDEDEEALYVTEFAAPLASVPAVLAAVRTLRRLERLTLRAGDGRACRYGGEPHPAAAGGLRRLAELRVSFAYLNAKSKAVPAAVVEDLVACAGSALRVLELDTYRYAVVLDPAAVARHLGLVERVALRLRACTSDDFIDPDARDEAVATLGAALRACSGMASLRRLQLSLHFLGNSHRHQCWTPVVARFREMRPDVSVDFSVQEQ